MKAKAFIPLNFIGFIPLFQHLTIILKFIYNMCSSELWLLKSFSCFSCLSNETHRQPSYCTTIHKSQEDTHMWNMHPTHGTLVYILQLKEIKSIQWTKPICKCTNVYFNSGMGCCYILYSSLHTHNTTACTFWWLYTLNKLPVSDVKPLTSNKK